MILSRRREFSIKGEFEMLLFKEKISWRQSYIEVGQSRDFYTSIKLLALGSMIESSIYYDSLIFLEEMVIEKEVLSIFFPC